MDWFELLLAGAVGWVIGNRQAAATWQARMDEQLRVVVENYKDRDRRIAEAAAQQRDEDR